MDIVPHISSIYANAWTGWVLLALLLLLVINRSARVGVIGSVRSVFSQSERVYASQSRAWGSELCEYAFRLGVLAMAVWVLVIGDGRLDMGDGQWAIGNGAMGYAKVFALVLGVYVAQRLLMRGVGHVFVANKQLDAAMEQYNGICSMVCVCLYPILLVLTNVHIAYLAQILCGGVLLLFVLCVLWKSIRLFYTNVLSLMYILIYIVFLEIMPIMVIFSVTKNILRL
jgi:hypothetical protein